MLVHMPEVARQEEHVSMFQANMNNDAVYLVPVLGSSPRLVMWLATCENSGLQDSNRISWAMTYHKCLQFLGGKKHMLMKFLHK